MPAWASVTGTIVDTVGYVQLRNGCMYYNALDENEFNKEHVLNVNSNVNPNVST